MDSRHRLESWLVGFRVGRLAHLRSHLGIQQYSGNVEVVVEGLWVRNRPRLGSPHPRGNLGPSRHHWDQSHQVAGHPARGVGSLGFVGEPAPMHALTQLERPPQRQDQDLNHQDPDQGYRHRCHEVVSVVGNHYHGVVLVMGNCYHGVVLVTGNCYHEVVWVVGNCYRGKATMVGDLETPARVHASPEQGMHSALGQTQTDPIMMNLASRRITTNSLMKGAVVKVFSMSGSRLRYKTHSNLELGVGVPEMSSLAPPAVLDQTMLVQAQHDIVAVDIGDSEDLEANGILFGM